jgi:predicted RNase H-like HicB family nuclease
MRQKFTASVWREGKWYVAQCLDIDVASQGRTEKAALKALSEALALHLTSPVATVRPKVRAVTIAPSAA